TRSGRAASVVRKRRASSSSRPWAGRWDSSLVMAASSQSRVAQVTRVFVGARGTASVSAQTIDQGVGMSDQFENKIDDAKGRAKEAAGAVTGDDELKHEGKADQIKASVKD